MEKPIVGRKYKFYKEDCCLVVELEGTLTSIDDSIDSWNEFTFNDKIKVGCYPMQNYSSTFTEIE